MPESINSKIKEQYDHDDSGGSLDTNLGDFLDSEGASGTSNNSKWRDWASGTGTSLNTRLFHKHGGSGSFMTRWKNWIAFSSTHSFNFDGSDDYLISQSNIDITGSSAFSMGCWFKPTSASLTGFVAIIAFSDVQGHEESTLCINSGKLGWNNQHADGDTYDTTTSLSADTWYHGLVTFNGSDTVKLYLNGSLIFTRDDVSNVALTADPLYIGKRETGNNFTGLIDEVAIWDAELSATDITSIYNNGKVIDLSKSASYGVDRTSNLIVWLRCGDKAEPESTTAIARQDFFLDFDGTDDYVDCGIDVHDFSSGDFTISGWIYHDTANTDHAGIVGVRLNDGNSANTEVQLYIKYDDEKLGSWNGSTNVLSNSAIPDKEWTHVALVQSGSNKKFYINGILDNTVSQGHGNQTNSATLKIGWTGSTTEYFLGSISNVSVYQTALDAQTISQMAKSRFTPVRDSRFSVVDFDGSNDFIDISSSLTPSALTFTTWIATVADSSYRTFIQCGDLLISKSNGNKVHVNKSGVAGQNSTTSFVANEWTHIAVTADSSGTKVYRNGVLDLDGSAIAFTAGDILIGKYSGGQFTSGSISSVAYYSSVKSAEEIYALYSKGITYNESSESGLVGYWRMGDDTSKAYPTIADSSSNSNDGTITNGASDDIVQQMVAGYDLGAFESSSEELGGSQIPSASNRTYSGVSSNDWTSNGTTKSFSNDKMIFTFDGDSPAVVAQLSASSIGSGSGIPNGFLKVTFEIDSSTTGTYNFNNAGGSVTGSIFQLNPISAGTHTVYANITNGNSGSYFRFYEVSGSTGDKLVLNSFDIQEVLQSEVSDTHPAIIDVNQPVLGVETITNGDFDTDSDWTKSSVTISGGKANFSSGGSTALYQDIGSSLTGMYFISFDITDYTSGTLKVYGGGQDSFSDSHLTEFTAVGSYVEGIYLESSFNGNIIFGGGAFTGSIDNVSVKPIQGNVGNMTNQAPADLVYSSVLPDQSFLATGVNSAYNFIDLGGTDEYISLPESFITDIATQTGTVNLWVKPTSDNDAEQQLFTYNNSSTRTDLLFRYGWGDNRINLGIAQSGSQKWFAYSATNSVSSHLNNWNMITLVHNGTEPKLYANGIELSITFAISTDKTFWFGDMVGVDRASIGIWNQTSLSSAFIGNIGQTSFWSKDLSASEILAIYNLGRHGNLLDSYSDNLLGYFAMGALDAKTGLSDVGDGTIYDRSGNSNHGTATNTESADLKSPPNAEPNGYAKGDTNRSTTTP